MSSATALPLAEADAARWGLVDPAKVRGTLSTNLVARPTVRAASAGRGPSHPPPPSGNPIPARAFQVAASPPGGGGLVDEAPANLSSDAFDSREVARIAAAYPPEAAAVPGWERKRYFTPMQLAAWEQRFGADES